jgi:hypothetical protein
MNVKKDLKRLGLITGKKKTNQLFKLGIAMWLVLGFIILISLVK